jgi:hypothetical protein
MATFTQRRPAPVGSQPDLAKHLVPNGNQPRGKGSCCLIKIERGSNPRSSFGLIHKLGSPGLAFPLAPSPIYSVLA